MLPAAMAGVAGAGWLGAGASLAGGLLTNASNAKTANKQMHFEAAQAQLNRNFQAEMSNTAHQREVVDLRAAGLNPILSATGGPGASTPTGSSAKSAGFPAVNAVGDAVNSALAARRNYADVKNLEVQNKNIQMDTDLKLELKRAAHEQIYKNYWEATRTQNENLSEIERLGMLRDQRPGSKVEGEIDRSWYGEGLRYVDRIGKTIGSALGARRLFQQGERR